MSRCLIVDDKEENRYFLETILKGNGYEVESADNGAEALEKARRNPPDIVISDILMPVMDGFMLCRELRQDDRLKTIPLIIYTATYTDQKDEVFALSLGVDRFLVKPLEPEVLIREIAAIIQNKGGRARVSMKEEVIPEPAFLKEYNEVLVRKLEDKMFTLEQTNRLLEKEIRERIAFEEKLREDEYRLSLIYETVGDPLYYLAVEADGNYRFVSVNQAFCNTTGLSKEMVVGKKVNEVIPEPSLSTVLGKYKQAIEENSMIRWEETTDYPTGRLTADVCIAPVVDDKGQCTHLVGSAHDITEARHTEEVLKENQRRLREVQEMAHLGFWQWDVKTGDVEWSDEVFKIFRLDPKEFTPHIDSILELSPWPEDHQRNQELINRAVESHAPGSYEQRFLRPDGSVGYYYSTFQGKYDKKGDLVMIVGTVLDITGRKKTEEEIRKLNTELEQRVAERTAELTAKTVELERINKVFVGRELRMREMKERIVELEKRT